MCVWLVHYASTLTLLMVSPLHCLCACVCGWFTMLVLTLLVVSPLHCLCACVCGWFTMLVL